ncbi:hypothetical protein [Streptomyces aureus]|uniref:hypothetical protein n=1 Tax=Streptomyces aureus TaxID=193461 RepID=UPI00068B7EB1|nr:hypothetical protein [Streptomyces aureus]
MATTRTPGHPEYDPRPGTAPVRDESPLVRNESPVRDEASVQVWRVVREPFRAGTWRRVDYALLAFPAGLVCVPLSLVGAPTGRWQRSLAQRFLGLPGTPGPPAPARGLAHALLAAPLNLLVLAVTVYGWSIVPMNLGWPLRAGSDYADSWGGPTFAGAWAFHALVGAGGFLLLMPWLGRAMAAVQLRLAAALLS